jgi:cytochrome c oxidase subunit 2
MESFVKDVDQTFLYIFSFSVGLLLLITGLMIFFLVRYRRSVHPEAEDIRGNWKLEVVWTVIPVLIALSMFYFGWTTYLKMRDVPVNALEIDVTAVQFSWIFNYPNKKESYDLIIVPLNKPVKLNITSEDVIHSLFIPAYRIKMDAVPGMTTYTWFYPDTPGTYTVLCTEYCGIGHADMSAVLRVVPEKEYLEWLEQ